MNFSIDNVEHARQALQILSRYIQIHEQAAVTLPPAGATVSGTPIADLELGTRTANVLRAHGIETVEELVCHSRRELCRLANLGVHTLDEITEAITARGLSLGQPFRRTPIPS